MNVGIIEILTTGGFASLFIYAFIYYNKQNDRREEKYQKTIDNLVEVSRERDKEYQSIIIEYSDIIKTSLKELSCEVKYLTEKIK